jgi:hypothetical protein
MSDTTARRTIHVVNWTPQGVGGFEWRTSRAEADRVAADQALFGTHPDRDETVQVHAVELPDEVGDDPEGITAWLDSEGWSDGGDPRVPAQVTDASRAENLARALDADLPDGLPEREGSEHEQRLVQTFAAVRAESRAAVLAELRTALAGPLDAYQRTADAWEPVSDDPSPKEAERHGEALETIAHALAGAVRRFLGGATEAPADRSWGWQGDARTGLDAEDPRHRDTDRPAPEGLAVFAHWSTAHPGVNIEVDAPDGLPLTVHVNDYCEVNLVVGTVDTTATSLEPDEDDEEDEGPGGVVEEHEKAGHHDPADCDATDTEPGICGQMLGAPVHDAPSCGCGGTHWRCTWAPGQDDEDDDDAHDDQGNRLTPADDRQSAASDVELGA